jgi:tetratricopeptide (TPR) repeat protein
VAEKEESKFGVDTNDLLKAAVGGVLLFVARWLISRFHLLPEKPATSETFPTPDQLATGIACFLWLLLIALLAVLKKWRNRPKHVRGTVEPDKIAIWVDELDGDTEDRQRDHVIDTLQKELSGDYFQLLRAKLCLKSEKKGNVSDDGSKAAKSAREYLRSKGGELLIWGYVDPRKDSDPILKLHFATAVQDGANGFRFRLDERLYLEPNFGKELGNVLAAVVVSAVKPAIDNRKYGTDVLEPLALRLDALVKKLPQSMNDDQRAMLLFSSAAIAFAIGENKGGSEQLQCSAELYRRLLDEHWTGESEQKERAAVQNNLGNVLLRLGERNKSTKDLDDAVKAYEAALKVRTRDQAPQDWAITKINLASTFSRLGRLELETGTGNGVERSNQAVSIYREVLKEQSESKTPQDWAMTQNNLADALIALGKHGKDANLLNEAVVACHATMRVWTRSSVPLGWAMAQKNLGDALTGLGEVQSGTKHFEDAVHAYQEALKEYTPEKASHFHQLTQQNLDRAQQLLKEREKVLFPDQESQDE